MSKSNRTDSSPADNPKDAEIAVLVKNVSKSFKAGKRIVRALDNAEMTAGKGRITGLVGPDGAGKTTLMRLLAGLLKPDAGKIMVMGLEAARHPLKVQTLIGYMPQRFGLYEDLSVMENLNLYADLQGVAKEDREKQYQQLMAMTNLGEFTSRLAGRLSGGMKQKLGLACVMIRSPELLILDEPTVGVDPVSRRELWAIVNRLVKQKGMSVFLSTTYLDEAEKCDEAAMLHEGRVLDFGKPENLSARRAGRTFIVTAPGMKKRRLQKKASRAGGVLDAVIFGDAVRVVTEEKRAPTPESLGLEAENAKVEKTSPRFEDEYVALLIKKKQRVEIDYDESTFSGNNRFSDPEQAAIRADHVGKKFGDFYAVKDVSFEVRRGEVFGLLGANGAGKTTTFRMLCGLLPASEGTLHVAGRDLRTAAAEARAKIGYMSQKFSLYGQLSVLENLQFFGGAYNLKNKRKQERIRWALEQFDLKEFGESASGELPLGFKQRLALACALMHEPEILFLDEPTSGVDPIARREFWTHINGLAENGVTVMVTTHFMEEAEYCDRLALMISGEILALGTPSDIKERAREEGKRRIDSMEEAFIALIEAREKR